jgi:hypothetical protein
MKAKVKLLTKSELKQKVEARLHRINQAIEALYAEVSSLQTIAQLQMEKLDQATVTGVLRSSDTKEYSKMYNLASDIDEWTEMICEFVDGIDTDSIRQKIKKAA